MRVVIGNLLLLSNKFSSYLKIHSVSGFNICLATSPAGERATYIKKHNTWK